MTTAPFHLIAALLALATFTSSAAHLRWSGLRNPCKISAEDGVTNLSRKIGRFIELENEQWAHAIFNVNNRFQGSAPWITMAVGEMPETTLPGAEVQDRLLTYLDGMGVDVFLELMPRKTNEVAALIDTWLGKFKKHQCVKGLGVDLEFFKRADDAMAQAWDEKIKWHNQKYRLFLKHWEAGYMPPNYRGNGDLIFINTSSEASVEALNAEYVEWAKHFAPSACAFQIGYPADEDGMDGSKAKGWWRLQDPIKNWGDALLAGIKHPTQEIGLLWVTAKSGKSYNQNWDLTRGATLPTVVSASAPPVRSDAPLEGMKILFDGTSLDGWVYNPKAWNIVDGAMRGTGRGGNIFTKAHYGSFRLIFTSRVASPEGNPGRDHLGVLFWGEPPGTDFSTSKALQVQPPHGAMWDYRTNKGLKPEHPTPRPRPRYQDWHVCEVLAKLETGEVRVAVDGLEITKYKHPDPSALQRGPIGMQIHAPIGSFDYKDIRIEADPQHDQLITVK